MSNAPTIDPALWAEPGMRAALAGHDISTVYRMLEQAGISQRQISALTGQSQSEICEIRKGRRVLTYHTLVRIAEGLGIPREWMGLCYGAGADASAYPDQVTVADLDGDEMLRRHFQRLLGLGAAAAFGTPISGIGELADLTAPPLPTDPAGRIGSADVALIRDFTKQIRALARRCGGQARASVELAQWADQWLAADSSDRVHRELLSVLAELHTIAGWCSHDSDAVARSHYHFARGVELATDAGDSYQAAYALRHAGMMLSERSEPNEALKLLQCGELRLRAAPREDRRVPVLRSWLSVVSAFALARLDQPEPARSQLVRARDGWEPPDLHARADMYLITGLTQLHLGQLDAAEATIAMSAQTFAQSGDRREGVVADVTLARLHVQAGESRGLALAKSAIDAVAGTRSGVARQIWLPPLVEALEARPGGDARELARMARHVATVST